MPRLIGGGLVACAFVATAAERAVEVSPANGKDVFSIMLVNPAGRKLYAGTPKVVDGGAAGLWVFDLNAQGELWQSEERAYACMVPVDGQPLHTGVTAMAMSPDRAKLYLGILGNKNMPNTLVVYDLDAKGEPQGKPRAYPSGNPNFGVTWILPNPRINLLYTVGNSGGVQALRTDKGEPAGAPVTSAVRGGVKVSILPNDVMNLLMLPCGGGLVEVVGVESTGEFERQSAIFSLPKADAASLKRIGMGIYFIQEGRLAACEINGDFELVGKPKVILGSWDAALGLPTPDASLVVTHLYATKTDLWVALCETAKPGAAQKPPLFRIARFKPTAPARLGKAEFVSSDFEGLMLNAMTADESTGVIYTNSRRP